MSRIRALILLFPWVAAAVAGWGWWRAEQRGTPARGGAGGTGEEVRVLQRAVDGDTLELEGLGACRLLGVNAPELWERTGPGRREWKRLDRPDPRAVSAYEWLRSLEGRRLRVQRDREPTDAYGRALVHLYLLPDGPDLAGELLRRGWADTMIIAPNNGRAKDWRDAAGGR